MEDTPKEIVFRKTREFGDVVADSFEFIKAESKPVFKLVIPYVLPFILVYAALQVYVQMKVLTHVDFSDPEKFLAQLGPVYVNIFFSSLFGVFMQSLLVGTYYSYIEFYIKRGRGNFTTGDVAPVLFMNTLYALGANLLIFMLVLVGVMLCIIPGIYLANSLSLVVMVLIFEKKGISHAFVKSWRLVNSRWWHTFGLNLLGVLIIYSVNFLFSLPGLFAGVSSPVESGDAGVAINYPDWYWVLSGISSVVSSLAWIVCYTFLSIQYFNLEERTAGDFPGQEQGH